MTLERIEERIKRYQRKIVKRLIVRGTLVLDTPVCLGNGNSDSDNPIDLMLLRDSISDRALLTGSSIAGALRNHLHNYENGYQKEEKQESLATTLFGGIRSQDDGDQSSIIIGDSLSIDPAPTIELRDGVKIDSETGTAKEKAKYDLELLAAGTKFPLYFEVVICEKDDKAKLIKALGLTLQGLEKGEISFGIKKRRGFGRCHVKAWQTWWFDLRKDDERLQWLMFDHESVNLSETQQTYESIVEGLGIKLDDEDKRDQFLLRATFKLASPLLIRSSPRFDQVTPDVIHLRSYRPNKNGNKLNSVPILSGTSLAGVLRHRAERIIRTLGKNTEMLDRLFGVVKENEKNVKASRLIVNEAVINKTKDLVQNRIAIDRFTGGAYHGALFDEQILCGSDETILTLNLELQKPRKAEIGLLLLLLKDLWTSDLPVGGGSSIGRGRLQGIHAKMTWRHSSRNQQRWTISQNKNRKLEISDVGQLEEFVASLHKEK